MSRTSAAARTTPLFVPQPFDPIVGHYRIWNRTDGTTSVVDTRYDVTDERHLIAVYRTETEARRKALALTGGAP